LLDVRLARIERGRVEQGGIGDGQHPEVVQQRGEAELAELVVREECLLACERRAPQRARERDGTIGDPL
jgi:hypothetical protein